MGESAELFTIGRLARRTGLSVRTIRFWSDLGVVPPSGRSAGGYRLYDAEAVARLELVRTLRELGLGLEAVREVLSRSTTLAEVARSHVAALDVEIRVLRLRRAVLSTVAARGSTIEETMLMHRLARLSAKERQQLIDDFLAEVAEGIAPDSPAMGVVRNMRWAPAELPDDPAPEQVDAWIELGELVTDEDFRRKVRAMAVAAAEGGGPVSGPDPRLVFEHAGRALAEGVDPASPEGRAVADRIVAPDTPPEQRALLLERLETFTDARVERYWHLLAVISGETPRLSGVPAFEWLIAALRAY